MGMKIPTDKDKVGRRSQRMQGSGNGSVESPIDSITIKKEDQEESRDDKTNVQKDSKVGETKYSGTDSFSKELARLQIFGAGPKMAGLPHKSKAEKTRGGKVNFEYDPVSRNEYNGRYLKDADSLRCI